MKLNTCKQVLKCLHASYIATTLPAISDIFLIRFVERALNLNDIFIGYYSYHAAIAIIIIVCIHSSYLLHDILPIYSYWLI